MGGSRARSKQASWDSSSDDELDEVSDKLYAAGGIQEALYRPQDYPQAVQELTALLQGGVYSTCFSKAAQALLVKDCSTAIAHCSGRMRDRRALAALMEAVERQLPQSKRNALLREYKKGSMALRRREKKGSSGGEYDSGSDSDGSEPTTVGQLPPEVVSAALAYLDPVSLASAACVCCEWRALASEDGLWAPLLERTFPAAQRARLVRQAGQGAAGKAAGGGAAGVQQAVHGVTKQAFTLGAQRHPRAALMWKSNRILGRNGRLSWLTAAEREAMLPPRTTVHASIGAVVPCSNRGASLQQQQAIAAGGSASQRQGSQGGTEARSIQPPRHRHLSPSDVAEYYRRGGRLPAGSGSNSSSSSSSGSDSEGQLLSSRLRFWRVD